MKLYYIVFALCALAFMDSLVQSLKCYKCDGDDDKNCTVSRPNPNAVEECEENKYHNRRPACRISVYYEWVAPGQKKITNVYRTGCRYGTGGLDDACNTKSIPSRFGSTECICTGRDLCNAVMWDSD